VGPRAPPSTFHPKVKQHLTRLKKKDRIGALRKIEPLDKNNKIRLVIGLPNKYYS